MEGSFSGAGDILLAADGTSAITLSGVAVNQTGDIVNSGAGTATVTISASIGENVGEVKQNSATSMLILSGDNSYQGPTTVAAGSLSVVNTAGSGTGSGAVIVQSNVVLRGTGTCLGAVTNMPGGILSPGTAAGSRGVLTMGELVWQEAGIYECDVNSLDGGTPGSDYDQIQTGTLTAQPGGGKMVIKLSSLGKTLSVTPAKNYTLWLMQYDSASGFDITDIEINSDDFLVSGGNWFVTNMFNSICYVNRDGGPITPDPLKNCWIGSGKWSSAANWSFGHAPLAGEDVAFGSWSTAPCTADVVNNNLGSITLGDQNNKVIFAPNAVAGGMSLAVTGDIAVNAGQLVFGGDTSPQLGAGYSISAANITVAAGASLNADEQGFAPGAGPSPAGTSTLGSWGASHGGYGGVYYASWIENLHPAPRYGSASQPTSFGSGGTLFAGGGAMKLSATGTIAIHGTLSASSTNLDTRAGSGGSIWIAGGTLAGTGRIIANGGIGSSSTGAGGGGGRIDISGAVNDFSGIIEAMYGGWASGRSGAQGWIGNYTPRRGMAGSIVLPQSGGTGLTLANFEPTRDILFGNSLTFGNIVINSGVTVGLQAYDDTTVMTCDTLTVKSGGTLKCWGDTCSTNETAGPATGWVYGQGPTIAAETVVVEAAGSINADYTGFHSTKNSTFTGPGGMGYYTRDARGIIDYYTSSAHGGQAGGRRGRSASFPSVTSRTPMYGKAYGPTTLGSGGEGYPETANNVWHSGGGAVKLDVSGTITVDGRISADAKSQGGYNQPSGGSVWITGGGTLKGNGVISANAANAQAATGGGGGGRLDISGIVNDFTGVVQAKGGNKYDVGSPQTRGLTGSLVLPATAGDSGAVIQNFVPYGTDFAFGNSTVFGDCIVSNGVVLTLDANDGENVFTFSSLTIKAGGEVRCLGNLPTINEAAGGTTTSLRGDGVVIIATNLTVEAGGSLNADGQGYAFCWRADKAATGYPHPTIYPGGIGFGPYTVLSASPWVQAPSAGAGFGGLAGQGRGFTYGAITNFGAGMLGSGTTTCPGGGSIRLFVPGTLFNAGVISANGGAAGGGSGGTLWIEAGKLSGTGVIRANGTVKTPAVAGVDFGGGGGRVFVSYNSYENGNPASSGRINAFGGSAGQAIKGAAGTVILQDKSGGDAWSMYVINDGAADNTSTQFSGTADGGPEELVIERVYIGANGALSLANGFTFIATEVFSNGASFFGAPDTTLAAAGPGEASFHGDLAAGNLSVTGTDEAFKTVKFEPGKTVSVSGALTLSNAVVKSSIPGSQWYLVLDETTGSQSVFFTKAKDSNGNAGQTIYSWKENDLLYGLEGDLGNNDNWVFSKATIFLIR